MRDIKFRAWDNYTKEMLFESMVAICDKNKCINDIFKDDDRYIWQQYIGLKDKNGKEIYEGDIVDFIYCKKRYVDVVVYERNNFCCENTFAPFESCLSNIEVIGNIYENPELLKGELNEMQT